MTDNPTEDVRIIFEDESVTLRKRLREQFRLRRMILGRQELIFNQTRKASRDCEAYNESHQLQNRLQICIDDLAACNSNIAKTIARIASLCEHRLVVETTQVTHVHLGRFQRCERCCVWCLMRETSLGENTVFSELASSATRLALVIPDTDFDGACDRLAEMDESAIERLIEANFKLLKN